MLEGTHWAQLRLIEYPALMQINLMDYGAFTKMEQKFKTNIQFINIADKGDLHNTGGFPYGMALI
ncbi:MAG: hypothetical protein CMH75_01215 [Nitrospina sp.]|nr:hypothetical protein [Nitrospina sp.]